MEEITIFSGEVIDVVTGYKYLYPKSRQEADKVQAKYDFIFTKHNVWFYMASCDDHTQFTSIDFNLNLPVENSGELWKIIDAKTGEIIESGGGKLKIVR